jgi:hypothetical protein
MVYSFVSGLITMGFLIAGVVFLSFWRRTQDALFAAFAVAFVLLGVNQGLGVLMNAGPEETGWIWLLRLAAFLLIIAAIVRKNLGSKPSR